MNNNIKQDKKWCPPHTIKSVTETPSHQQLQNKEPVGL